MTNTSNSFKTFKPHTNGMRTVRLLNRISLLKKCKHVKSLVSGHLSKKGRNNSGQITCWHKGGGHKRLYRHVDFLRKKSWGLVEGFEYDPYRNSWINRLFNPDIHFYSYILGIKGLKTGDYLKDFYDTNNKIHTKVKIGSHLYLKDLPSGFVIHNLSSNLNKKGQYLRAAGAYGQLITKTSNYARIKLRSGEHRLFPLSAAASLGSVCNEDYKFTKLGKAGRNRWYGRRPIVRGVAINPVDHPHGGGEGRTSGGRPSVTPWGKPTKGQPTKNKSCFSPLRVLLKTKKKK